MKILILGVTGMLGHKLFNLFSRNEDFDVYGTARSIDGLTERFSQASLKHIKANIDGENMESLLRTVVHIKPDLVMNCIGIIKQLPIAGDHQKVLAVNSLLPHRLVLVCQATGARLIQFSTDCVFNGRKGNYTENDIPDATDLYGRSKSLGEIRYPNCLTLRVPVIGHELKGKCGLVEWFLAQEGKVKGYTNVIFSGFPTTEIERILREYVIPNHSLEGLYHVSAKPISKYELLKIIAEKYGKRIGIEPWDHLTCDRSLNSESFRNLTGYVPPEWPELIDHMYQDYLQSPYGKVARR